MEQQSPSSELRRRIKHIFQAAAELDTAERAIYLAEACPHDSSMRAEIEALIAALKQPGSLLEIPDRALVTADSTDSQISSLIGESLGRYRILGLLGRGGMGEVYKARDATLGRNLAIKVLPYDFSIDQDRLRRFEQEARAASTLNHPNILTIHELGQADGVHFIATELIEGQTLRTLLKHGRMAPASALETIVQVASALEAAHAAGVIHRDIKPENVMVRNDGLVKVVDFGLAKHLRPHTDADAAAPIATDDAECAPGIVMGTFTYMSPEQARGLQVDARTDIFSLGVVLYEMIVGRTPCADGAANNLTAAILNDDAPPLRDHLPAVPVELERIVSKALCRDLQARYQTIKELNDDLKVLSQKLGTERESSLSDPSENHRLKRLSERGLFRIVSGKRQAIPALVAACAAFTALVSVISFLAIRSGSKSVPPGAAIESIAILPFKSLGPQAGDEYLAVGMADTLGARLSHAGRIVVRPMSATRRYSDENRDPLAAGRELQVDAVLDGSVHKSGGRIQVVARLINVRDGTSLWASSFDEKYDDLFMLQDSIVKNLLTGLGLKLTAEEGRRLTKRHTESAEAYDAYLKGRFWWNRRSKEAFDRAIEFYNEAIALDRNYALPYAGLADCYTLMSPYGITGPKDSFPKARAAAMHALAIDDQLAEAHASLAHTIWLYEWDFAKAEAEFKRAILLDLNYPVAHQWYSVYLSSMGRHDEAIAEAKLARKLDPLSISIIEVLSRAYYHAGRYDEAITAELAALELNPQFHRINSSLELAYAQKGLYAEAIEARLNSLKAIGVDPKTITLLKDTYTESGWKGFWRKELELTTPISSQMPLFPYLTARIHARLGENDRALKWLEKAYKERMDHLVLLKVDPVFKPLRSDPQFKDLLRRIGFEADQTSQPNQ